MKLTKQQETKPTIRFNAELNVPKTTKKSGSGTFLTLPKNVSVKLLSRDKTSVEGTINGLPFRSTLETDGKGVSFLRFNKSMHDAVGTDAGETVAVEITRVTDEQETRVPMDLSLALATAPKARSLWADITPIARRDWIFWIIGAKQPETRKRRIEKACSKLSSGMRRVCCFAGIAWLT